MFKTARMRKIKIMTLDKYVAPTVRAFHEQGLIQISDMTESIQQDPELAEMVTPSKATPLTGKISSLLMKANGISDLFGNSLSEGHGLKDKLMSFISPDIPTPREVEDLETEAFLEKAEETLNKVEAKTSVIEGKLAALDSEVSELKSNKSLANNLNNFDMDLALLKDSKYTSVTVGRIDAESASEIKNKLGNLTDELDVFVVPEEKATAIIVVITLKEFTEDVQNTLRDFNFEKFEIGNVEGKPQEIISKADSRLQSIESERATVKSDLRVVAEQWDDEILILKEQLENEKEKNEIFSTFVQTDDTYILEAWVPVKDVGELAFDHNQILEASLAYVRQYVENSPAVLFDLLPRKFTAAQLRRLYEIVYDRSFDVRNFHKRISMMKYVVPLEEKEQGVSHRAARYYRFDRVIYNQMRN